MPEAAPVIRATLASSKPVMSSCLRERAGRRAAVMIHARTVRPVLKLGDELHHAVGRLGHDSATLVGGSQGRLPEHTVFQKGARPFHQRYRPAAKGIAPLEARRPLAVIPEIGR